jgi:hypothetical protein
MSLTSILMVAVTAVLLVGGIAIWLYKRRLPELSMTETEWEGFRQQDLEYEQWKKANPGATWFMVRREYDGLYYLTFYSKRGMRRFRGRWLSNVPNQAPLTRESRPGTGLPGN